MERTFASSCVKPRTDLHICDCVHLSAYVHQCACSMCEYVYACLWVDKCVFFMEWRKERHVLKKKQKLFFRLKEGSQSWGQYGFFEKLLKYVIKYVKDFTIIPYSESNRLSDIKEVTFQTTVTYSKQCFCPGLISGFVCPHELFVSSHGPQHCLLSIRHFLNPVMLRDNIQHMSSSVITSNIFMKF